jgi:hypothetical protein
VIDSEDCSTSGEKQCQSFGAWVVDPEETTMSLFASGSGKKPPSSTKPKTQAQKDKRKQNKKKKKNNNNNRE